MTEELNRPPVYRRERCQVVPLLEVVVLAEFPDHEIHRDGTVYRVRGKGKHGEIQSHIGHRYGYKKIKIMHAGVRHGFWLHRLICRAFHGEPPEYNGETAHVRHRDGDPSNNHADNLCYGSRSENMQDKKRSYGPLVTRYTEDPAEGYDKDFFG